MVNVNGKQRVLPALPTHITLFLSLSGLFIKRAGNLTFAPATSKYSQRAKQIQETGPALTLHSSLSLSNESFLFGKFTQKSLSRTPCSFHHTFWLFLRRLFSHCIRFGAVCFSGSFAAYSEYSIEGSFLVEKIYFRREACCGRYLL